jgi:hypothetical protein
MLTKIGQVFIVGKQPSQKSFVFSTFLVESGGVSDLSRIYQVVPQRFTPSNDDSLRTRRDLISSAVSSVGEFGGNTAQSKEHRLWEPAVKP